MNKSIQFQIILISFHKKRLLKLCQLLKTLILKINQYSGSEIKTSGPLGIPQKIYKICVIKSPFVYKKSQELFEIRTFKQILICRSSLFASHMIYELINSLRQKMPPGIDMKIKIIS